ncbi:MAG: FGGY family carbohydrate kinase, partial [Nocardioidaceae bacterium]
MSSQPHVLVLDEGTTSTRAVLFDQTGAIVDEEQQRIAVHTPTAAVVEQDATEIADKSVAVLRAVIDKAQASGREIVTLGVTNQRTTTVLWDRSTGEPVAPVVGWQDTRAADQVESLRAEWSERFTSHVGLILAAACVPLHLVWLFYDDDIRRRAESGDLLVGTPDSWVIWKLTGGPDGGRHLTSYSNATSTGAMDIASGTWWAPWLDALGVPAGLFAEICAEDADYGATSAHVLGAEIPIRANFADQHAALFGHGGFEAGAVKCTHGTGSFVDFNIGPELVVAGSGLDTRVAWQSSHQTRYMVEGSSFATGSAIDWLVDGIGALEASSELDATYARTPDSSGLVCVPALAGFTAPYWDPVSRGILIGLNRGTTRDHIV